MIYALKVTALVVVGLILEIGSDAAHLWNGPC